MIGNDLVDLRAASFESNWKREGYLQKLFSESEQALIIAADNPGICIWTLWSMKESAYKVHSRKTGQRKFAPSKLLTSDIHVNKKGIRGIVEAEGRRYFTKTLVRKSYVYSIAAESLDILSRIYTQVYFRPALLDYKAYRPGCISHHGDYLALAFSY